MATKRVILDNDFGQIIIRTRTTARNISMRTKPDGLHVIVPPYCLTSKVLSTIEEFRPQLLEKWQKVTPQALDLNFRIETPCFRLHLETGRYSRFTLCNSKEGIVICCPPRVDFSQKAVQDLEKKHCHMEHISQSRRSLQEDTRSIQTGVLSLRSAKMERFLISPTVITKTCYCSR